MLVPFLTFFFEILVLDESKMFHEMEQGLTHSDDLGHEMDQYSTNFGDLGVVFACSNYFPAA